MRRALLLLTPLAFLGCRDERVRETEPPTYDGAVRAILASRCSDCHETDGGAAAGRWRGSSYLEAIACVTAGKPSILPADDRAPLLRILQDPAHAPLLTNDERATLVAWVSAGAPKFRGSVHEPSFADPRSPQSHGRALREKRWRPMLDKDDPEACGRCHEGTARPDNRVATAFGAASCTSCHAEERGVLACGTCHVARPSSFPPRDACFFPDEPMRATAHPAHTGDSPSRAGGLPCESCHLAPPPEVMGGAHGDGKIDVVFDAVLAGASTWDAQTGACAAACHLRPGGARPRPLWTEKGPLGCNDCHSSPPPAHFAGACSGCHREANATGTALTSPRLHVNGVADVGDGSGTCGACHGKGNDPWPESGAHAAHRAPGSAAPVPCVSCHVVPTAFGPGTGHPRADAQQAARVTFSGRALTKGAAPTYANGTCSNVYCHGRNLVGTTAAAPAWNDTSGKDKACGSCHGLPPGPPHFASPACDLCHGKGVESTPTGPRIVPAQRALHVDGQLGH